MHAHIEGAQRTRYRTNDQRQVAAQANDGLRDDLGDGKNTSQKTETPKNTQKKTEKTEEKKKTETNTVHLYQRDYSRKN